MKKVIWFITKFFIFYFAIATLAAAVFVMLITSRWFLESPIVEDFTYFEDRGCETIVRSISVAGYTHYEYLVASCTRRPMTALASTSVSYTIGRIDNKSERDFGRGFFARTDGNTYLISYCPRLFLHPKRIKPEGISDYNRRLELYRFRMKVQWREDEELCSQPMKKQPAP